MRAEWKTRHARAQWRRWLPPSWDEDLQSPRPSACLAQSTGILLTTARLALCSNIGNRSQARERRELVHLARSLADTPKATSHWSPVAKKLTAKSGSWIHPTLPATSTARFKMTPVSLVLCVCSPSLTDPHQDVSNVLPMTAPERCCIAFLASARCLPCAPDCLPGHRPTQAQAGGGTKERAWLRVDRPGLMCKSGVLRGAEWCVLMPNSGLALSACIAA